MAFIDKINPDLPEGRLLIRNGEFILKYPDAEVSKVPLDKKWEKLLKYIKDKGYSDSVVDMMICAYGQFSDNAYLYGQRICMIYEFYRIDNSGDDLSGHRTLSPHSNQERILFRNQVLVGICPCRRTFHSCQPSGGERNPEPCPRRNRLLLLLEYPGTFRTEGARQKGMVPKESQKEGLRIRYPIRFAIGENSSRRMGHTTRYGLPCRRTAS